MALTVISEIITSGKQMRKVDFVYSPIFSHLCKSKYTELMAWGLKRTFKRILSVLTTVSVILYAWSCATIVSPTGGPKDIKPPDLLSSQPKNLSTNFNGNRIILNFDEYIQLKTPEKFLLISPPLSKTPDIKVKGRSVIIKLEDSLRINTTYNFYLGEAITDITESNPVPNFNFAFSTGPTIDSLSLSGNVTDAFTRLPAKGVLVMLYSDFTDSVPMKQIPLYVSRTTDNGSFSLNSLASGKYRAVALLDGNSDYKYNLPTEQIGFSSDSVEPSYNTVNLNDTNAIKQSDLPNQVSINLFAEPDSTQRVLKSVIASKNRLSLMFRYPVKSPGFRALNVPDSLPWSVQEWNPGKDTLNAWLVNTPDTLKLEVSEKGVVLDTVTISTAMKTTGRSRNTETATPLRFTTSVLSRVLGYGTPLVISFVNPVKEAFNDSLQLTVMTEKDTTIVKPQAAFTDSIHRHLLVTHNWNPAESYDLYIPKGAFTDIYSDSCDSTHVAFRIKSLDEYGKFAVTVNRPDQSYPVIIQLITEKGAVISQQIITSEKRVDFGILSPGKYGLKAILDSNANGRWDTGIFLKKIQPEKVVVHPKIFEVRTNWELEETWDL